MSDEVVQVTELEIWGSALNTQTGMVTLFLVRPERRTQLEAEHQGELPENIVFTESEFAIEMCEHEVAWATATMAALAVDQHRWHVAKAAQAKLN